ncbi:hypothetical protein ES705_10891 [subsurface metagenome]
MYRGGWQLPEILLVGFIVLFTLAIIVIVFGLAWLIIRSVLNSKGKGKT